MDIKNCTDVGAVHFIDMAAKFIGGRNALADRLQVTTAAIGNWKLRGIPPKQCVRIEQLTSGAVTRRDLRPDDYREFWPELDQGFVSHAQVAAESVAPGD